LSDQDLTTTLKNIFYPCLSAFICGLNFYTHKISVHSEPLRWKIFFRSPTYYGISTSILANRHPFGFFYTVCRKSCHFLL